MRFSDIPRGGREKLGATAFKAGVMTFVILGLFAYFGFSKSNPFSNPYELHAVFKKANRVKQRSPVRIAGVKVGQVVKVEPLAEGDRRGMSKVTMEIDRSGLPIKEDAQLTIRSRLFLEGNYFVDLHPGRPTAKKIDSGHTIGPDQTASPVQFGQVLTALQSETREELQTFLREYSNALKGRGAAGFNQAVKHWEEAYKNTSQVNDAFRGTEEHDLTRVLRGQARVFGALSSNEEALKNLVTDLADTLSGFARQEDNLSAAIPELRDVLREGRPALRSLDTALPSIRGFARDALPGARSSSPTLDAQLPFIRQARRLVARRELGGLVRDLRATVPHLATLNKRTRLTLQQSRLLSSCQNNVLLPFVKTPIPDPDFPDHSGEPWYEESGRALVGLAGESRLHDANSSWFRAQVGGGPTTIANTPESLDQPLYAQSLVPVDGIRPIRPSKRPVFRPDIPCETQEPPNMKAVGGGGDQNLSARATSKPSAKERRQRKQAALRLAQYAKDMRAGRPAVDPLVYNGKAYEQRRKQLLREEAKRKAAKRKAARR
jgi:phospholipid/cholesterol/gamma-HCH transport system substrate-binding protein